MQNDDFIPVSSPYLFGNEKKYVNECLDTGWVSSIGSFVRRFESDFAGYCSVRHGATVNTGTAALHLVLAALRIGPGDEVILPALTFASTANVVLYQGATPVFADCSVRDWNMDPGDFAALVTPRTRAVIPVHLYGQPCDMDRILTVAKKRDIDVIEDAAEAHGATVGDARVGALGRVGCFSFYGNKVITTGEGGMCVTNDAALHERMCMLRDHGMDKAKRYWHQEVGFNYRMTNLQAAVGCAQLERIDELLVKKRSIRDAYSARLAGSGCLLPQDPPYGRSIFWLYTLLLPEGAGAQDRDALMRHLAKQKIDSRPIFYPVTDMPPYRRYARPLPHTKDISARGITLPSFHALTTQQIDRVCTAVLGWLQGKR